MGLLIQLTGQNAKRQRYRTWRGASSSRVIKEAGNQTLGTNIDKGQATVVVWVVLRPILNICNRETGYEVGGRHRNTWWQQTSDPKQLSAALEDIWWWQGKGIENPSGVER